MAIVGPSGCGKTTLLKIIAGLQPETSGKLFWDDQDLSDDQDLEPWEIGYVPQFSIAHDELTVDEAIEAAAKLTTRLRGHEALNDRLDQVLHEAGLTEIADRRIKVLSGGQKRRLGLALELVTQPKLLLCDEVTSGLDPRSERDIVTLLHRLSRKAGRIVLSVTHSLAHLELYDSILVLHEGRVAYHGPPDGLTHYFSVSHTELIYPQLAKQSSTKWQTSWQKHATNYYQTFEENRQRLIEDGILHLDSQDDPQPDSGTPGLLSQTLTLLARRLKIFFRDPGQVLLQLAIIIGFPLLVILFAEPANENLRQFTDSAGNLMEQFQEQAGVQADQLKVGSAVSGIILFQVVLLCLMGSNNAAREIAGERTILEKEKFSGVRPLAYLISKLGFLALLVLIQSTWMAFFVEFFWPFKGTFTSHLLFLLLVNFAMTAVSLGISSLMKTTEQASLLSVYLVGFQLPLSGAVLALPAFIEPFTRPLISSFWSWSGSVQSLSGDHLNAVRTVTETQPASPDLCMFVLLAHVFVGCLAAFIGINRPQWK